MKNLLVTLLVLSSVAVSAQIEKGTTLITGQSNLNFTSAEGDGDDSEDVFNVELGVGYFVAENFVLGPVLSYAKQGDASVTGIGVFGRYYVNGKVFFGAGYTSTRIKFEVDGFGDVKSTSNLVPLEIGYAAFLNSSVAIEPSLGYTIISGDADGSAFGLNVGISVYLNRE